MLKKERKEGRIKNEKLAKTVSGSASFVVDGNGVLVAAFSFVSKMPTRLGLAATTVTPGLDEEGRVVNLLKSNELRAALPKKLYKKKAYVSSHLLTITDKRRTTKKNSKKTDSKTKKPSSTQISQF